MKSKISKLLFVFAGCLLLSVTMLVVGATFFSANDVYAADKLPITITSGSATKVYDGTALTKNTYEFTAGVLNTAAGDKLVVEVTGSTINAGSANNTFTCKVMRGTEDVTDEYAITKVEGTLKIEPAPLTLTSASDTKRYNTLPLTNETVTAKGFIKGESFNYNVTGSQTAVGTSKNTFTYTAGAGTNVYNYEVTKVEGDLTVTGVDTKLTITANSNSKMYDGTALYDCGYFYAGLVDGDTIIVIFTTDSSITHVGIAKNEIDSYTILDADCHDVTVSYSNVETVPGTLEVTPRDVILTSGTATKKYDGTPLTNETVTVSGSGFAGVEGATYDYIGTQTKVGTSKNDFSFTLNGGVSADNYDITCVPGDLTVTPNDNLITITADSDSKMYDGAALTDAGYTVTGILATDDYFAFASVIVIGTITDVGTATNKVSAFKIENQAGDDVTSYYINVETVEGTLEVTKRSVTLTSGSNIDVIYSGTAVTNDTINVTGDGWANGEGATYNVTGSQTLVGESKNTFTYTLNSNTKASNYDITTVEGTLSVTAIGPAVVTADAEQSKEYDGEAFTPAYTETNVSKRSNDYFTWEGTKPTDVGTVELKLVIKDANNKNVTKGYLDANGNAYKNDYILIVKASVTPRKVDLVSGSSKKDYDRTALTNDVVKDLGSGFVAGEGATYTVTGAITSSGTADNEFTYTLNANTKASNYEIKVYFGTLEVVTDDMEAFDIKKAEEYRKLEIFGTDYADVLKDAKDALDRLDYDPALTIEENIEAIDEITKNVKSDYIKARNEYAKKEAEELKKEVDDVRATDDGNNTINVITLVAKRTRTAIANSFSALFKLIRRSLSNLLNFNF